MPQRAVKMVDFHLAVAAHRAMKRAENPPDYR
jgi:hypothetical protein